ncbi:hypothetical protein Hanom_Chr01g00015661 [Helianthus anomalus]
MTVKLPIKPVWLKDPTQVSMSLLSLPTSASLYTKWKSNLHLSKEMQALYHLMIRSLATFAHLSHFISINSCKKIIILLTYHS